MLKLLGHSFTTWSPGRAPCTIRFPVTFSPKKSSHHQKTAHHYSELVYDSALASRRFECEFLPTPAVVLGKPLPLREPGTATWLCCSYSSWTYGAPPPCQLSMTFSVKLLELFCWYNPSLYPRCVAFPSTSSVTQLFPGAGSVFRSVEAEWGLLFLFLFFFIIINRGLQYSDSKTKWAVVNQ